MTERKEEYRYASKRSVGDESCYINLHIEEGETSSPTYEFKAYPNWNAFTYKLYAANALTKRKFAKPHIVSMNLVREYK